MCDYVYKNGRKCRLKSIEGSKYCPLHISFEEGEKLLGDKLREVKDTTFQRRLKSGQSYFEGVYLYDATIRDYKSEKMLVFRDSTLKSLILDGSEVKGLILIGSTVERLIVYGTALEVLLIKDSNVFGLNVLRVDFSGHISIRDSSVKYLMINSTRFTGAEEGEESSYGERSVSGLILISNLRDVRRVGLNTRYPLMRRILEEHGVNISREGRRAVRARELVIRGVSFDFSPRFKRHVRLTVSGFSGRLVLEDLDVFGHVEIAKSHLRSPEFIHVVTQGNLVLRGSHLIVDSTWAMTVLPSLPVELTVGGFMVVENCRFNNPNAEELFYRLARTSWEKSGDFERADGYYYLEMLARRKARLQSKRRGVKRLFDRLEVAFEWLFADLTCRYGTDWKRPILLWLAAVNFIFPLLFWATKSIAGPSGGMGLLDYEYFSIVTATTIGYGDYHPIGAGRAIASLEALFGTFMWAVFLTVFARKYMR